MMSAVLLAILGIWLLLVILAQFKTCRKWMSWLHARDYCALMPEWSLFAPEPVVGDLQLLYRDKLLDGRFTLWKEVPFHKASLVRAIWNPEKRRLKTTLNAATLVLQMAARNPKSQALFISHPYMILLMCIISIPRWKCSDCRQFVIVRTFGYDTSREAEILLLSPLHKL